MLFDSVCVELNRFGWRSSLDLSCYGSSIYFCCFLQCFCLNLDCDWVLFSSCCLIDAWQNTKQFFMMCEVKILRVARFCLVLILERCCSLLSEHELIFYEAFCSVLCHITDLIVRSFELFSMFLCASYAFCESFHLEACKIIEVFLFQKFCRSHKNITMVKAVVVLNSSEGVSGTVQFTQEGDGMIICIELVAISLYCWVWVNANLFLLLFFRPNNCNWKPLRP